MDDAVHPARWPTGCAPTVPGWPAAARSASSGSPAATPTSPTGSPTPPGSRWALRRPPTGMVLATAHDMSREWRFITALAPTPVPVARPVAYCADAGGDRRRVLPDGVRRRRRARRRGGRAPAGPGRAAAHRRAGRGRRAGRAARRRPGRGRAWATCAAPAATCERQLRRWHRQVHESAVPDLSAVDAAHERLVRRAAALPPAEVADRARRLPAGQPGRRRRTAGYARCSTGSWPRSATRSPTWAG